MDLAAFLLARIAEDEAAVHAGPEHLIRGVTGDLVPATGPDDEPVGYHWTGREYGEDLSIYPERVLAECEAKRRIVAERMLLMDAATDEQVGAALDREAVLSLLALPYADHPDYRDEWRPRP